MIANEDSEREEDALHVFLLMGEDYRISRSIRAQWFFQQFNSTLPYPKPEKELIESNEELEVLSIIPNNRKSPGPYRLLPSTHVTFIGRRYRFVFCLDISPSSATVDIQSGTVITDEAFAKLKNCLCGLVAPFFVDGNSIVLSPELYITVLAYTSILNPEAPQVLVQGCLVTQQNVNTVLDLVHDQIKGLEDFLAKTTTAMQYPETNEENNQVESDQGGLRRDSVRLMSPEVGPVSILRNALLALQLLPSNASAGAVVITDGVFALPDASAVDSLLAQLRASTVCCSFIKLGSGFHAHCSLGYVPHCDLMQFIAMATSGAYLAKAPPVSKGARDGHPMNLYHRALLCLNFQKDFDLSKIDSWIGDCLELSEFDLARTLNDKRSMSYALSKWEQNAMQPSMRKRHLERKLHTSITSVLSVRLREGYSIQDVSITKGGKQLQVKLTIPWKHNVQIEYLALSAWPIVPSNCITHVEVTTEAPYEFLSDVTCPTTQHFTSGYRTLVVKRFRQMIKSLQNTDEMLVHLQSFSSNSSFYTIPESAKNGVPLFYLPPNSTKPVLSLQDARKSSKSQESHFAKFWKSLLSLDTTEWQRWMHVHKIGLVLEHDVPLPDNLYLAMANNRSSAIQCQVALRSLSSVCRNWSSFVLLENNSYVKFIYNANPEDPPSSFSIAHITIRGPCIVIKVAFLGGTPGNIRNEIVSDLRSKLSEITAPQAVNVKSPKVQAKTKNLQRAARLSSQRAVLEKPCAIMYHKSLDRILVRYERIPQDLFTPFPEVPHYKVYDSVTGLYAHRTNENHMKTLCQYLHHHRWIWPMQDEGSPAVSDEVVARVLSTLTELRLQEGFKFVNNSAGIITMAKEITMKDHLRETDHFYTCIIQYVLFPPYHQHSDLDRTEDAIGDWEVEGKLSLAQKKQKLNVVTEVWAEPQFGILTDLNSELKYLEGLQYNEVPHAIFQVDVKHVSALLSFDHVRAMCNDHTVTTPQRIVKVPRTDSVLVQSNWVVEQVPFPFDVISLLPKTRQVEMVFSSLIESSPQGTVVSIDSPNESLFKLLLESMERLNDREVMLTNSNSLRFTQHLQNRNRNGIPLPFPEELCDVEHCNQSAPGEDSSGTKVQNKSVSSMKWRCFVRAVTACGSDRLILTFLPASFKYVRLMCKHGRNRSSSAGSGPRSPRRGTENGTMEASKECAVGEAANIEEKYESSLLPQSSLEDGSLTPTPTLERSEIPFPLSQQTDTLPESSPQTAAECTQIKPELSVVYEDEKRSVTFQDTKFVNDQPVFHDRLSNEDSDSFSFNIPIYCYDCPISALKPIPDATSDREVTTEEAKKREDIFQDFTRYAASIILDPFSSDEIPRSLEGRTKGRFGSSKDLLLHTHAVHDLFFRSVVTSTFASLQNGHPVSMQDVHLAVDACEENFLEVDITEFIHTLCGHHVKTNASKNDIEETQVREDLELAPCGLPMNVRSEERVRDLKDSLSGDCESVEGLHKSIRAKFMSILGKYFKAIPPSGEFFFYCPQLLDGTRKSALESFSEPESNEVEQIDEDDTQDKDSDIGSDTFDDVATGILIEDDGFVTDVDEDWSDFESDENSSGEFDGDDDEQHSKSPLFLQLTCSLRDRSSQGQPTTTVSISTLPVCLGEIIKKFEDDKDLLDPFGSSVRITLDLICLTLPSEPDYTVLKSSARSVPSRSNSFSSTSSPLSISPQEKRSGLFDFRRQDSKATSHDIDGSESMDRLYGLLHSQQKSMNSTCDAIRWLLQDEIVSELRHIGSVTTKMLEKVERHVTQSENPSSCFSRNVRLQFVCGAEQSLKLFFKEFERITLPEYSLKNVEKYYYLTSLVEKQHGLASLVSPEIDSPDQIKRDPTVEDDGEFGGTIAVSEPAILKERHQMGSETGVEVGKQNPLQDELNTPVKGNSFASSPNSTPVGKLFLPSPDDNTATTPEDVEDDRSTSPRTPRQDEQKFNMVDECLQFWLVLKILEDKVTIFFHRRETDDAKGFCASRATGLVEMVTNAIHEKCLVVNQRMLLHQLHETKVCNSLLFPESDEDIWRHEVPMSVSPQGVPVIKGDSKGRISYRFVQVQFLFQPGHFRCKSVWHTHLPVHQRLMDSSGRTGISRGLKAVKTVLDRFGVSNRKDMFVYKDSTGAVFYFRLFESLCSNDSPAQCELHPPYDDDDDEGRSILSSVASLAGSTTSSLWSLVKDAAADGDDDETDSKSKRQLSVPDRDRDTMSDSGRSLQGVQAVVDKSIALHVYGVDDPGPEITVELVEVLQNRLNEAMLEVLSLLLSRNPNCKLTYSDVRFIQPQGQPPKTTLTMTIPPMDVNYLCPLSFYLRQNLLQMLHTPRYSDSDPSHRFRAVSGSKVDATGNNSGESRRLEPEAYLYNRPHSSGGKGLACISVSVLNSRGGYIYIPCGKTACNQYAGELENFEQFTEVFVCEDKNQLAEDDIMVQFSIWERGDIGLEQLSDHLKLSLRHALCDLLAEYYLLTAPLSEVPEKYRRSQTARPRSCPEPRSEKTLTSKSPTRGSCERSSKRRLDFSNQSGFRGRRISVGGHRRTSSAGNTLSSGSSGSPSKTQFNPFLSQQQSVSSTHPVSRQSTFEDEVFKPEVVLSESHGEEQKQASEDIKTTQSQDLTKLKSTLEASTPEETAHASFDVEQLFESLTPAEIQESQEYTSQPGTPVSDHGMFASKVDGTTSEREKSGKVPALSAGHSLNKPSVLQDAESRRRKEQENRIKRIQFENGERGELHSSLQGLGQDMFALFFDLGVSSVYRIDGKLVNNFAPDPFLAELVNLISSICPDIKPRVFRECSSSDIAEGTESGQSSYMNCLHYFPARQPLKVQDMDESSADKSGKRFAPLPNSSNFFVVVGRNMDQWRASMGFEEDFSGEDPSARPKIRPALQCFKPLDPNAPTTGRISSDSNSLASLSVGGVPRQKFLLVTILDKDVNVFTYNWAADLNHSFDKQLHRLLNWSNARCHLTSCLLSQKLGLFHHTLFADINKGKENKDMNPFCLSANDEDIMALISRPGPPSDRERALPRQLPPSPNLLVFDQVLREVTPPKPLYRASYFHNRDIVKRHGYQFKEIRFMQIKKAILEQTLDDLYRMWQRVLPSVQISEDKIETLKRSSRMIHYCAAPLLFHPDWRRKHSSKEFQKAAQQEKEEEPKEEKPSSHEEAWHQDLKSAYVQQYVQYMQSLQFIVVQTRPQSPKPNRRHIGRSAMARKAMDFSASDGRKENASKSRKESGQRYLQRSSHGGIMLLELGFQGRFFVVRLYSLGCSQIPSGKTVGIQVSRMFVEECTRYREYIHLLSFNYDFHLCKAQMYLNGSQRTFNKGYAITDMLKSLLLEYPHCPFFARNRACEGEIAVPSHPGISPQDVFNYLVKNASKYEFSTLPLETAPIEKAQHVLLGTQRVLTQEQSVESKAPDILRENNDYDITFVVTVKESPEEGVVCMAYVMLMTSRRDLFPKLTLDWLRKKSPSSSSLSTMNGARKGSLPENEDVEQEKVSRVRFTLPNTASSGHLSETVTPPSPGEFHRSASSPHFLFFLGSESSVQYPNVTSFSEENIVERSAFDNACQRESNLLTEAFNRAHDHLVHVVCRAQAHCNRDLLWQRLLVGGTGREERESGKRGRRRSEVSRSGSDVSVRLKWIKAVEALKLGADQASSPRLSFKDFKQLLSVVVSKSLKDEDPQLISLLSMGASWYINLFSVITAKFPDTYRLFTSEDNKVRYLVILNADNTDMFILFHVNEQQDTADVLVIFREEPLSDDSGTSRGSGLLSKKIRSHVYSVINSVCFHLWTRLLPP